MKHKVRGRDGVILKPAPLLKQNTEQRDILFGGQLDKPTTLAM